MLTKIKDVVGAAIQAVDDWGGGLTGQAAIDAQINHRTGEEIKRRQAAADEVGGDENAPEFPDESETFPDDMGACQAILQEREAKFDSITNDKAHRLERGLAWKALERIRKHFFKIQQGPTAPIASINDARHAERQQAITGAEKRTAYLAKLAEAEKHIFDSDTFVIPEHADVPVLALSARDGILRCTRIRESLSGVVMLALLFKQKETELFSVTQIRDRSEELKVALMDASNGDEVREMQNELARLRSPEAENLATMSRRAITEAKAGFETSFRIHITHCLTVLRECLEAARKHEAIFFADYRLPREETSLSRKYTTAIALLEHLNPSTDALRHFSPAAAAIIAK